NRRGPARHGPGHLAGPARGDCPDFNVKIMNLKRPTLLQGLAVLAALGLLLRLLLSRYTA
ncbi:MAG: hypothetical protein WCY95_04950, partial [Castellaniella sp.]